MPEKCPTTSFTISPNSPGAFLHNSPPILQPKKNGANEHATSVTSPNRLGPFSGSSFLLSSLDTADGEVLETAQKTQGTEPTEYPQSQLQSNKPLPTHMECTWQQPVVTYDLSEPEHAMAKTAIISLSSPRLNDVSNVMAKLTTEAGQAKQMDAQKEQKSYHIC